jgi:hypothetical protein
MKKVKRTSKLVLYSYKNTKSSESMRIFKSSFVGLYWSCQDAILFLFLVVRIRLIFFPAKM